jgi:hypothetical protein
MIQWTDQPPDPGEFAGIRLIRVPPKSIFEGVVTSPTLQGCPTHYAERRTQPCTGDACRHCLAGHLPRWLAYLSIQSQRTRAHVVLELTALAAGPIAEFAKRHATIRGTYLTAERTGARPNAPVHVNIRPHDSDQRILPPPVDLKRFFALLWHLTDTPTDSVAEPHQGPNIRNSYDTDPPGPIPEPANSNGNGGPHEWQP